VCRRTVKGSPQTSGLGEFDNDQYFDLALMPYPPEHAFDVDGDSNSPAATQAAHAALAKFPNNVVFTDGFQGKSLVHPRADSYRNSATTRVPSNGLTASPSYVETWLHCEAEGDFWARMLDLAAAMGVLGGVTAAATVGGAIGGAAAGCAIAVWLFGVGCIIGAIIGAIIGGAAAAVVRGFLCI
jgi:hypothetical protein